MSLRLARLLHGRLHYAWIVGLVIFLVLLVMAGVRAAMGVLIIPLEHAFGWKRETVSGALAVGLLLYGLVGPFAAALMQRFGVRGVVAAAVALVSFGAALSLFMSEPWHLTATWGAMVGVGGGMVAVVLGAIVASRWFVKHRGLVMGIFMASVAAGQLVFLPVLAWIAEHGGWRPIAWVCALAGFALFPAVLLLVREHPADVGLAPLGAVADLAPARQSRENPIAAALRALAKGVRTRDFWLLGGTFFVCGLSTSGLVGTHLIPMCFEAGVPQVMAAGLLAMMGVFNVAGTTLAGWATDRWDSRRLLCAFYAMRGVSLIYLPNSDFTVAGLTVFSVLYGLDWLATAPPTLQLITERFSRTEAPMIFGWIFVLHQLGAALAAWGAGLMRTAFNGYLEAFVFAGVVCLLGAALVLTVGRGTSAGRPEPVPV